MIAAQIIVFERSILGQPIIQKLAQTRSSHNIDLVWNDCYEHDEWKLFMVILIDSPHAAEVEWC